MELHYPIYWGVSQSISWEIPIHQWTGRTEDIMRSKSRSDSYCKHLLDSNDSWAMLSERELHKLSDCSDLRQGKVTSADRVGFLGHSQILPIMGLVQNYQSPRMDGFSMFFTSPGWPSQRQARSLRSPMHLICRLGMAWVLNISQSLGQGSVSVWFKMFKLGRFFLKTSSITFYN